MRTMLLVGALLGSTRLRESGSPSLQQAKDLADSTNLSVDAQEARAQAIIDAKDQVVADTNAALDLARANAVDQELIDKITAIKTNAEDNFAEAVARKGR